MNSSLQVKQSQLHMLKTHFITRSALVLINLSYFSACGGLMSGFHFKENNNLPKIFRLFLPLASFISCKRIRKIAISKQSPACAASKFFLANTRLHL